MGRVDPGRRQEPEAGGLTPGDIYGGIAGGLAVLGMMADAGSLEALAAAVGAFGLGVLATATTPAWFTLAMFAVAGLALGFCIARA